MSIAWTVCTNCCFCQKFACILFLFLLIQFIIILLAYRFLTADVSIL
jgi:hypothetical protein